jgi:hypothetical protein
VSSIGAGARDGLNGSKDGSMILEDRNVTGTALCVLYIRRIGSYVKVPNDAEDTNALYDVSVAGPFKFNDHPVVAIDGEFQANFQFRSAVRSAIIVQVPPFAFDAEPSNVSSETDAIIVA